MDLPLLSAGTLPLREFHIKNTIIRGETAIFIQHVLFLTACCKPSVRLSGGTERNSGKTGRKCMSISIYRKINRYIQRFIFFPNISPTRSGKRTIHFRQQAYQGSTGHRSGESSSALETQQIPSVRKKDRSAPSERFFCIDFAVNR